MLTFNTKTYRAVQIKRRFKLDYSPLIHRRSPILGISKKGCHTPAKETFTLIACSIFFNEPLCANSLMEAVIAGQIIDRGESTYIPVFRCANSGQTKKKRKPDETLRDRNVENPHLRMSLVSTILSSRPRLDVQSNCNAVRRCFVFNFPAFNTALATVRGLSRRDAAAATATTTTAAAAVTAATTMQRPACCTSNARDHKYGVYTRCRN